MIPVITNKHKEEIESIKRNLATYFNQTQKHIDDLECWKNIISDRFLLALEKIIITMAISNAWRCCDENNNLTYTSTDLLEKTIFKDFNTFKTFMMKELKKPGLESYNQYITFDEAFYKKVKYESNNNKDTYAGLKYLKIVEEFEDSDRLYQLVSSQLTATREIKKNIETAATGLLMINDRLENNEIDNCKTDFKKVDMAFKQCAAYEKQCGRNVSIPLNLLNQIRTFLTGLFAPERYCSCRLYHLSRDLDALKAEQKESIDIPMQNLSNVPAA